MALRARQRSVRLGGAATALALACGLLMMSPVVAEPAAPPAAVDVGTQPPVEALDDWREPTASADAPPAEIVDGALKELGKRPSSNLKITSVTRQGGAPVVATQTAADADDAKDLVAKAQRDPRLLAVEVDARSIEVLGEQSGGATGPQDAPDAPSALATNDPRWSSMWGLARLQAETVWATTRGSSAVKVAVVDTGVAAHEDLPSGQILAGSDTSGDGGVNGRSDGHGHGTHVAGTIVASVNNSIGVAGLAPNVTVLPVKVLKSDGRGTSSAVAQGIIYAANQGADVISLSLGGGYSSSIATAVAYAIDEGSLVIAAAGNDREDGSPTSYPAALPGVLGVAATASDDSYAYFSNAGSYVDISAPGQGIWSTLPGDRYASWSGTSMSTPHVSAVAALVISRAAELNLADVPVDVLLTTTADDLGATGWDADFGAGIVDPVGALAALGSPTEPVPNPPTNVETLHVTNDGATVSWSPSSTGAISRDYVVSATPGSHTCTVQAPAISCRLTQLDPQTSYSATVVARNLGGSSASSNAVAFTTESRSDAASDLLSSPTALVPGTPAHDIIDRADDLDFWAFTSPAAGAVNLTLTNLPADYDLYLYDQAGEYIGHSWLYGSADESITVTLGAGKYVALVRPFNNSGSTSPYRLAVSVPAAVTPPSTPPAAPPSAPAPPPAARSITRSVKVQRRVSLPARSGGYALVWTNQSLAKCSVAGRKVTGKKPGTCKVNAYAVGQTSLGVRVKATIKVKR